MRVEILKSKPSPGQWAPSATQFTFRPAEDTDGVHTAILVPGPWLLVGEPEPMLVCRVEDTNVFVTLSATEALMAAMTGAHGFRLDPEALPPGVRVPDGVGLPEPPRERTALAEPESAKNGRANLPAKRRK